MDHPETDEPDESRMTGESRVFATQLFSHFPEFRRHASVERTSGGGGWRLTVSVPAPSRDPQAELVVYVDGANEPSVAFGGWHTHESVWAAEPHDAVASTGLLELIAGILTDRFIICEDVGGGGNGRATILDLHKEDALLDEITDKHSPGRVRLRSWTGRLDREVSFEDLDHDRPA